MLVGSSMTTIVNQGSTTENNETSRGWRNVHQTRWGCLRIIERGNCPRHPCYRRYERLAQAFVHSTRNRLFEDIRNPECLSSLESHQISPTRSWVTSPPIQTFNLSNHALSCRNHGFNRAGVTSSASSCSLRGTRSDGSRLFQCQKRVPLTTSGI